MNGLKMQTDSMIFNKGNESVDSYQNVFQQMIQNGLNQMYTSINQTKQHF